MSESMKLVSVNLGHTASIRQGDRVVRTGIDKRPSKGPVSITPAGLEGDAVVDLKHHGGPDQAVYAYSEDDYGWWAAQDGKGYAPGVFGENLTIRGLPSDLCVGDRLLIGEAVLEATSPRIPCATFAAWVEDPAFVGRFRDAEKPGIYFRVLNGGTVQAGDAVILVPVPDSDVTILELFRFVYADEHDPERLRAFLAAPVAERMRAKVTARLTSARPNAS